MKKKVTRQEEFLAELDAVMPWTRPLTLIGPHYPKVGPKGGRLPMPPETMLRVYFLQNWYAPSDPMADETLYGSEEMRRFAGIELGDERIYDGRQSCPSLSENSMGAQDHAHRPLQMAESCLRSNRQGGNAIQPVLHLLIIPESGNVFL
jgi:hypothetical protein